MDHSFAQQVEAGAAVHLSFDCFDPVDVAFGGAGTVGQGERGGDGGEVLADAGGEGVQFGLVVGFDVFEPGGQVVLPGALGHHFGEAGDVAGEAVELCAVAAQLGEQVLLAGVEVLGAAQQPAGYFSDLQCFRREGRGVGAGAQWLEVAVDGAPAAAVAQGGDLGVQYGGVVAAFGPPSVQVGLVAVQDGGPGHGPGHRLVSGGGLGEAAAGLAVHAQFAGDRAQAQAAGGQGGDGGVLVTHPRLEPRFRRGRGGGLVWFSRELRAGGRRGDLLEAGPVTRDGPGRVLGEVMPQVPAVGDLDGAGGSVAGAF